MLIAITPNTKEEARRLIATVVGKHTPVAILCAGCGKETPKTKVRIQAAIKNDGTLYCTNDCSAVFSRIRDVYACLCCGKAVERTPAQVGDNVFCGSSCSATYNNKLRKRAAKDKPRCPNCGSGMYKTSTLCHKCSTEKVKSQAQEEFLDKEFGWYKRQCNNDSSKYYTYIRNGSRRLAKYRGMDRVCYVCGYDIRVDLCHIRPISSFPDTATMREIHQESNLVYLCPNHHAELDLGLLKLPKKF